MLKLIDKLRKRPQYRKQLLEGLIVLVACGLVMYHYSNGGF